MSKRTVKSAPKKSAKSEVINNLIAEILNPATDIMEVVTPSAPSAPQSAPADPSAIVSAEIPPQRYGSITQTPLTNKRFTPGTALTEYRVVRSQRKEFTGYWVQGGTYQRGSRGMEFRVCQEYGYPDLNSAKQALLYFTAELKRSASAPSEELTKVA